MIRFRLSEDEAEALDQARGGLSRSNYFRSLLRRDATPPVAAPIPHQAVVAAIKDINLARESVATEKRHWHRFVTEKSETFGPARRVCECGEVAP